MTHKDIWKTQPLNSFALWLPLLGHYDIISDLKGECWKIMLIILNAWYEFQRSLSSIQDNKIKMSCASQINTIRTQSQNKYLSTIFTVHQSPIYTRASLVHLNDRFIKAKNKMLLSTTGISKCHMHCSWKHHLYYICKAS